MRELVAEASGKTKLEVMQIVARMKPKPDVPSEIRELPERSSALPVTEPTVSLRDDRAPAKLSKIEPLAEMRHKVTFTASDELRAKLERLLELTRHSNPTGDLAVVIERAADLLLAKVERERLGKTSRPRKTRGTKEGAVSQAVRREVFERDGAQCTYVSPDGERCPARSMLELDHVVPKALGGADVAENLRVRCRPHNLRYAEQVFGKEHVARSIHLRRRKSRSTQPESAERAAAGITVRTHEGRPDSFDLALRGLVTMGFGKDEARRAMDRVPERVASDDAEAAFLVREALAFLR